MERHALEPLVIAIESYLRTLYQEIHPRKPYTPPSTYSGGSGGNDDDDPEGGTGRGGDKYSSQGGGGWNTQTYGRGGGHTRQGQPGGRGGAPFRGNVRGLADELEFAEAQVLYANMVKGLYQWNEAQPLEARVHDWLAAAAYDTEFHANIKWERM